MESQTTTEISTCLEGKTRKGRAYPRTHAGNVRIQTTGPHLRTWKPVSNVSRERAIKLVGGRNKMHVGTNPKHGSKSANGIINHYRNICMSRRENSGGHGLPPNAHGQRTNTTPRPNLRTCKSVSKGSRERAIKLVGGTKRNARRSKTQTGHKERKWNSKPLQKYLCVSKGKPGRA